jgi:hypothetical protein
MTVTIELKGESRTYAYDEKKIVDLAQSERGRKRKRIKIMGNRPSGQRSK